MTALSLYDNVRGFLRVSARVVAKRGEDINVGEEFIVRVTVNNTAYPANLVERPRIVFDRPRVFVEASEFTQVIGGNRWHQLPDQELFPGESTSVDIAFRATSEISNWFVDLFSSERIARVWVAADLDQNRFFEIWNVMDFDNEIEPT